MGVIVLDAGVVIGFLDNDDAHHAPAVAVVRDAIDSNDGMVLPASAYAEILVGPSRRGPAAVDLATQLVARLPLRVEPLTEPIAIAAADLRARHPRMTLPDALVVATATHLEANQLVTTDRGWPTDQLDTGRVTITEI